MEVLIRVYLLLSVMKYCLAITCDARFKVESICSTTNLGPSLATYTQIKSRVKCVLICSRNTMCLSSVYDSVKENCFLYAEYKNKESCESTLFYTPLLENACHNPPFVPGDIFYPCTTSTECLVPDSECRDARCQCLPGLSYDPATDSCITSCITYGTSFQNDHGHLLVGFSDGTFGTSDPEVCKAKCLEQTAFTCASAELWSFGGICYLSVETAFTQPEAREPNADYNLYQRDCAP